MINVPSNISPVCAELAAVSEQPHFSVSNTFLETFFVVNYTQLTIVSPTRL